jgi:hypothetical protein
VNATVLDYSSLMVVALYAHKQRQVQAVLLVLAAATAIQQEQL